MDPTRGALVLVALYCDERQWLGSGCDGDVWPAVDVVQRIALASPALYFSDLRCLTCLISHRYRFRLGEYSGLGQRPVTELFFTSDPPFQTFLRLYTLSFFTILLNCRYILVHLSHS